MMDIENQGLEITVLKRNSTDWVQEMVCFFFFFSFASLVYVPIYTERKTAQDSYFNTENMCLVDLVLGTPATCLPNLSLVELIALFVSFFIIVFLSLSP